MKDVPEELLQFLRKYNRYFILGHREPDGDALSSQLALAAGLKQCGKAVCLISPGPFQRREIGSWAELFTDSLPPGRGDDGVVILDCSTPERIGEGLKNEIDGLPLAVIDHHTAGTPFGDVRYVDGTAPATTLLVGKVLRALGLEIDGETAQTLLFGFCTDTGFFRHLGAGTHEALQEAARWVEKGASPHEIHRRMYSGQSLGSRLLLGRLLSRVESLFGGKVLFTYEYLSDIRELGKESRDSDTLYAQLLAVSGCEAVMLIREEGDGLCSVGLRSRTDFDVGQVARAFGGGGHRNAAGFAEERPLGEIRRRLKERLAAEPVLLS